MYGPKFSSLRKDFWMELLNLFGLTFMKWCVGGDFNVIRGISKKLGVSRLTLSMRECFVYLAKHARIPCMQKIGLICVFK